MTAEQMKTDLIPGSADRDDIDPTSTSIAFEPCRVDDAFPPELVAATYDRAAARVKEVSSPGFKANYSPYDLRNLNAFVSLGRYDDAFRLLSVLLASRRPRGWRGWAEVVWSDVQGLRNTSATCRTPGSERNSLRYSADVAEGKRRQPRTLRSPRCWWTGEGITLNDLPTAFGVANLTAHGSGRATVDFRLRSGAGGIRPLSGSETRPGGRQPVRHPGRRHHEQNRSRPEMTSD